MCEGITRFATRTSSPIASVQRAVLNGLSEVGDSEPISTLQVCDRSRNLKDAIVGARGETLLLHGTLQKAFGVGTELAVNADLAGRHLGVGEDLVAGLLETGSLPLASCHDAGADLGEPSAAAPPRSSLY